MPIRSVFDPHSIGPKISLTAALPDSYAPLPRFRAKKGQAALFSSFLFVALPLRADLYLPSFLETFRYVTATFFRRTQSPVPPSDADAKPLGAHARKMEPHPRSLLRLV
jgi:hypothetical protein